MSTNIKISDKKPKLNRLTLAIVVLFVLFVICILGQMAEPIVGSYLYDKYQYSSARVAKWYVNLNDWVGDNIDLDSETQLTGHCDFNISNDKTEGGSDISEVLTNYYFKVDVGAEDFDLDKVNIYIKYTEDGTEYTVPAVLDPTAVSSGTVFFIKNTANPQHWHFLPAGETEEDQSRDMSIYFEYVDTTHTYEAEDLPVRVTAYFEQID